MRSISKRNIVARFLPTILVGVACLLTVTGCGSSGGGGGGPDTPAATVDSGGTGGTGGTGGAGGGGTQQTVTLGDPSSATLTAGVGSSTITATVLTASGTAAADGTIVTFAVSPSNVAAADTATVAVAGGAGRALATIRPLKAGTATITAKALGVTSAAKTLSIMAPQLTIASDKSTMPASSPGGAGATIAVTAKDHQGSAISGLAVSFSTTLGSLTPVTSPVPGTYQVTLTSTQTGTALVSATALGGSTDSVAVSVTAGAVASLSVTPTPSQIKKGLNSVGTSEIALAAQDALGNPTGGVSVTVSAAPASVGSIPVGANIVVLDSNGRGKVTFTSGAGQFGTATITATADNPDPLPDFTNNTATVQAVLDQSGEPANILLAVQPASGRITVAGVGGNERAIITATVVDIEGKPIDDSKLTSNIEFKITKAPGNSSAEKPFLEGQDPATGKLILTTSAGVASANLQSGTRPGTVEISVTVTRAKDGSLLTVPLSAVVPQITIDAGPAASVFLSRSNSVQGNGDGTITHDYLAIVSDQYGNAVPDGTSVYFGQFMNILDECRTVPVFVPHVGYVSTTCADGSVAPDGTVTSASASFQAARVAPGDTWVSISSDNPYGLGGYQVDAVSSETSLALETTLDALSTPATGLEWAVGNNKNLSGAVLTPGSTVPTKDGVAMWPNTYAGELANRPVYVHVETGGKGLGHARWFHLAWVAPTVISINGPSKVSVGATASYSVWIQDSSAPTHYSIPDTLVQVTAGGGTLSAYGYDSLGQRSVEVSPVMVEFLSSSRSITTDYQGGWGSFDWTPPPTAAKGDTFDLSVWAGGTLSKLTVTIQ